MREYRTHVIGSYFTARQHRGDGVLVCMRITATVDCNFDENNFDESTAVHIGGVQTSRQTNNRQQGHGHRNVGLSTGMLILVWDVCDLLCISTTII